MSNKCKIRVQIFNSQLIYYLPKIIQQRCVKIVKAHVHLKGFIH